MRALVAAVLIVIVAVAGFLIWDRSRPGEEEGARIALSEPAPPAAEQAPAPSGAETPAAKASETESSGAESSGTAASETVSEAPKKAQAPAAAPKAAEAEAPSPAPAAPPKKAQPAPAAKAKAAETPAAEEDRTPPSFDVVRVSPKGEAVIAGRAEPGATVEVVEGDKVIARTEADARGEWVAIPDKPIAPGTRELSLVEKTEEGTTTESDSVVVLAIPERTPPAASAPPPSAATAEAGAAAKAPAAEEDVLAVLVPREGSGSQVMQAPKGDVGLKGGGALSLDTIEYDEQGNVALGGRAQPGGEVRAYIDGKPVGRATADEAGAWRLKPEAGVAEGVHHLRVDQVEPSGKVVARVETPFSRSGFRAPRANEPLVVVQPGNSLWRIARRVYGGGLQYVLIFEANRDQIRDPDLIYPGQIFVLPEKGAPATAQP